MDIDDAYDNISYIPDAAGYEPRWSALAKTFRQRMAAPRRARLGLMYGPTARQVLDLFLPEGAQQGLVVFVHGGYWRRFDRTVFSHLAQGAVARGWAVAMPSYDLVPQVRISDITRQVARAVTVASREVGGPLRLVGHSAGGHLVARLAAPNMLPPDVATRVDRLMPISSVSDVRPLVQTRMNTDFRLDAAEAQAESPVLQPRPAMSVTVWVGSDERPAFLDQSRWLAEAWDARHVIQPGANHFTVVDGLSDADSAISQALLAI
ncbi:alpha/beta hydrolase [Puniceibacterium sp. IMCC21224]|uniref:alpha/beta hydrolase n=1 Tax=Puniceibacterium sp. IMCC21224 TaxID=1618204 RepID=UPI00064DB966|nr:alpha/beta hydrolase [Puniceibacterium sp. IMCC21224]KMK65676.1 esterase/lipase [Puniceibacterium sp. IMCC21224]